MAAQPSPEPPPAPPQARILVVEDQALLSLELESILTDAGFAVVGPVSTVEDALRHIEADRPAAALLDANLHGRPAVPIADRLAQAAIPFVFVTGYSQHELPPQYAHVPVVSKPFMAREIIAAVKAMLA